MVTECHSCIDSSNATFLLVLSAVLLLCCSRLSVLWTAYIDRHKEGQLAGADFVSPSTELPLTEGLRCWLKSLYV